ncbi:MAG: hypothetical protein H7Y32_10010 [Chloroflexales bacterium]|nr:hypothetical protein [Chloroflexales bacterium]
MRALFSIGRFFIFWAVVVVAVLGGLGALFAPPPQASALPTTVGAAASPLPLAGRAAIATAVPTLLPVVLDELEDAAPTSDLVPTPPRNEPTHTPSPGDLRERVVDVLAQLRSGTLAAVTTYQDGSRASARVRFDLGNAQHPPRLHFVSGYAGAGGVQSYEQIVIGDRTWQRQGEGAWAAVAMPVRVDEALRDFLPQLQTAPNVQVNADASAVVLGWYDASRNADLTLLADLASGLPQQLTRAARDSESVLAITYLGWNDPVTIDPPTEE